MHREDFPFFKNIDDNNAGTNARDSKGIVYLDNAASSQMPLCVVEAMNEYYLKYKSNIHRGVYDISELASGNYDNVRKLAAVFLGVNRDDIILTSGSTIASNMLIYMLERYIDWQPGDIVITSYYEHHSILLPIIELARRKDLKIYYVDHAKDIEWGVLLASLNSNNTSNLHSNEHKVKLVSLTMASNVTGEIFDIEKIVKSIGKYFEKDVNIGNALSPHGKRPMIISDMTAIAGHSKINLHNIGLDAAWCGAHKMCGPTGAGVLYIKRDLSRMMRPVIYGGGMVWKVEADNASYRSDIEVFEAGTSNISGIIGMGTSIKYLESVGLENIKLRIEELHEYAIEKLSALPYLKLYTCDSEKNVGIISFSINKIHPHDIAQILSDNGVAVRAGHHCAQMYMKYINEIALTRISIYFYNTKTNYNFI